MAADILHVAIAQISCDLGDLDANVARHAKWIREARDAGVQLLMFPELSLTGYRLNREILDVALSRDDPVIRELAAIAPGMTVSLGLVEEGPAAQLYNAALVLRGGNVLHLHRKLNLPNYGNLEEGKLFATGNYVETFTTGAPWRQSVLICADLWNPALVHLAMLHGATLLMAPVNSALDAVGGGFSNPEGWRLAIRFYAMMYGMPILMANRVGDEAGARFWGGSCIVDPYGEVLADAGETGETPCARPARLRGRAPCALSPAHGARLERQPRAPRARPPGRARRCADLRARAAPGTFPR